MQPRVSDAAFGINNEFRKVFMRERRMMDPTRRKCLMVTKRRTSIYCFIELDMEGTEMDSSISLNRLDMEYY